jgi:hypothetical protein
LLLLCFTAADTLYSLLLIPRYFAARLTIASVSRRFSIIKAIQAAMKAIFLSRCFSLLKPSLQQRAERNCIFPARQYQQDFLITPLAFPYIMLNRSDSYHSTQLWLSNPATVIRISRHAFFHVQQQSRPHYS